MPPLISVILPVYNASEYIAEAINSILEQTFTDFELIIINDGSTDNSQSIIDSFDDNRIRVFQKPNTGLIDSLNLGVSYSQANWIARMDADDVSCKNRFEEQIKYISDDIAVIGSQAILIDADGKIYGETKFETKQNEILLNLLKQFSNVIHPSVIINKAMLLKVGGYDPKMYVAEDYDLWLRISKIGKIINVNQNLLSLRKHVGNISITKLSVSIENCLISLAYYFKSKSSEIMTFDEYEFLKKRVKFIAGSYIEYVPVWEKQKAKINSFSLFFRIVYLTFHPYIIYNYIRIIFLRKKVVFEIENIKN